MKYMNQRFISQAVELPHGSANTKHKYEMRTFFHSNYCIMYNYSLQLTSSLVCNSQVFLPSILYKSLSSTNMLGFLYLSSHPLKICSIKFESVYSGDKEKQKKTQKLLRLLPKLDRHVALVISI